MLQSWKKEHEAKFRQEAAEIEKRQAAIQQTSYLQKLSDREIEEETQRLRKARYFARFPTKEAALAFAARVDNAELAAGSSLVRSRALAWCTRLLSHEATDRARQFLERSKVLGPCEESRLAEAFILSLTDKDRALRALATTDRPAARSAALRIITNHDRAEGALNWIRRCALTVDDLDSDGKFVLLTNELAVGQWEDVIKDAQKLSKADFENTPVLYYAVAMAYLVQAVPEEYRSLVVMQVPFEACSFPLASDSEALNARRQAAAFFSKTSDIAQSFGVTSAANLAADYALWLQLRDPQDQAKGHEVLRSSLAFAQSSPKAIADYIAKHRAQLYEHLQKPAVQMVEIGMLARAGLIDAANDKLTTAVADGLGQREEQNLRRMISESESADPAFERRKQFEQTSNLGDLANLREHTRSMMRCRLRRL
jgi:hypothetical protein